MKPSFFFTCLAGLGVFFSNSALASDPLFPKVSHNKAKNQFCYMHSSQGYSLDLSALCGSQKMNDPSQTTRATSSKTTLTNGVPSLSNGTANGVPSLSSTGKCDFPWQTDSLGRECGDRSASRRPGGRTPVDYSPSFSPASSPSSSSGTVNVGGYTNKNGTYVKPHTRRK